MHLNGFWLRTPPLESSLSLAERTLGKVPGSEGEGETLELLFDHAASVFVLTQSDKLPNFECLSRSIYASYCTSSWPRQPGEP